MRCWIRAALLVGIGLFGWELSAAHTAAFYDGAQTEPKAASPKHDTIQLAQDYQVRSGAKPRVRPKPGYATRPAPVVRPDAAYRPGYRPGYRPAYRPGWRPPPGAWRPAYPGWRPGWAPRPYYGSYWRPGYGWAAAAGIIAVGVLAASAASTYPVPPPPNPAYCWFYTDQTYQTGYWAPCPPAP